MLLPDMINMNVSNSCLKEVQEKKIVIKKTTPSVDSGNQSEFSPVKQEANDAIDSIDTHPTQGNIKPLISNGDDCKVDDNSEVSESELKGS